MPNSDNEYGVFNKQTKILWQPLGPGEEPKPQPIFESVEAAKSHFFTAEALQVMDETCTVLEWALHPDSTDNNRLTALKMTFAFGTKGGNIAEADDWGAQYNSRKTALNDANNWMNNPADIRDSNDHLA